MTKYPSMKVKNTLQNVSIANRKLLLRSKVRITNFETSKIRDNVAT